jgi:glutamate--cysteine ligase
MAWAADGSSGTLQDYTTARYLGLIRNFHRHSWLLIYLFGASPAVCASFLRGRPGHHLQPFDTQGNSLYLPYATSLRMGGLGYNSSAQKSIAVCYNTLDNYLHALRDAILTPHPGYAHIPSGQQGDYQQLNDSLLQIENEFYSTVRPKRVAASGETPLTALHKRGIEYIEVRCMDVNPFMPEGIDADTMRFLDTFLLHCLLADSPECSAEQQSVLDSNLEKVVERGREPGLQLNTPEGERPMVAIADELLQQLDAIAQLLDHCHGGEHYARALELQRHKVRDADATPSARVLREMREQELPFYRLALNYSARWAAHYKQRELRPDTLAQLEHESAESLAAQRALEASEQHSFSEHLAAYYAQYSALQV